MAHMPTTDPPDGGVAVSNTRLINTTAPITGGGDLSADRTIALADGGVTLAKMADLAAGRFIGRITGSTGVPEAMTGTQATTLLDAFTSSLKGLVPASGGGTVTFLRADGTFAEPPGTASPVVDVTDADYGATGDGVTDDRAAIALAVTAAKSTGYALYFPAGTYYLSRYLDIADARRLRIFGDGDATILYSSDDTGVSTDATATSTEMARAGFLLRNSRDIVIEGLTFEGGTAQDLTTDNVGVGIYATKCVGVTVRSCVAINGAALYAQDATADTTGTGDSLGVSAGVVTLTDSGATFSDGQVGLPITITGCTNQANNGTYVIASRVSATVITFANSAGVNETSSLSWSINDSDGDTRIDLCRSFGTRRPLRTGSDAVISRSHFELPGIQDATGRPDLFSITATTVTLTDNAGRFLPIHGGRYIRIAGSTSAGNDGLFVLTYVSSTQVTYTNASGVTEAAASASTWWIPGGDRVGLGNGASAIAESGGTVTFTAASAIFAASDVGKVIRLTHATTDANDGAYVITGYTSPTVVTYTNSGAVSEAYAQVFSVDSYDNGISGSTYGSTHAIYLFAGRSNVLVEGCTFRNIRTTCVKVSGSSAPIRGIQIRGCYAKDCGNFATLGADDTQEHEGIVVDGNVIVDCGTGRKGWSESVAVELLGARGVNITGNLFHYSRNSIRAVDGSASLAGLYAVQGARYVAGMSQPLEDITISGNKFTADPLETTPANILIAAVQFQEVGLLQRNHTGGSLTKSGTTMTCTIGNGLLTKSLVGASVEFVNTTGSGNNGTFTVSSVPTANTFTFENASGTGGGNSAGTKRIGPPGSKGGGVCQVVGNEILSVAPTGVLSESSVAPTVMFNTFRGCEVNAQFNGDVSPKFAFNREIGRASDTAAIRFNGEGVSWPIVHDNHSTNNAIGPSRGWGMGIGVGSGTRRDFPLLGQTVRCLPTDGKEEVVIAWGSKHTDGDTVSVDVGSGATVYTFKTVSPTGNQFNTYSGLMALIAAQTGVDCTDYGTGFDDSAGTPANINTYHLRIRRNTATANTDGTLLVVCTALYPTALVALPNTASPNATVGGRGSGTTGPTANKTVIWSPLCSFEGVPVLVPDNAAAATLMAANSYYKVSNITGYDGGSNDTLTVGTTGGTEQWRARL